MAILDSEKESLDAFDDSFSLEMKPERHEQILNESAQRSFAGHLSCRRSQPSVLPARVWTSTRLTAAEHIIESQILRTGRGLVRLRASAPQLTCRQRARSSTVRETCSCTSTCAASRGAHGKAGPNKPLRLRKHSSTSSLLSSRNSISTSSSNSRVHHLGSIRSSR